MSNKLSVIVPAYNEGQNISFIYNKIKDALGKYTYELIFVDDGSSDNTFNEIEKISLEDANVRGISFSRNFGHQVALLAGLKESKNEIIVMLDADGQHPPTIIPKLVDMINSGFDIVNTRRLTTKGASFIKKISSKFYYKILNSLTEIDIEYSSSDFRVMTRRAVDAFISMEEQNRFTRGMISWMGFSQTIIEYDAQERFAGKSKYTLKRMLRFGVDGITSFSSKPLRISFYAGLIAFLVGFIYGTYAIVVHFMGQTVPGWTSILLSILFMGGVQLLSIGVLGEYLAKIYDEIKKRPHFFIKNRCGNWS